MDNQNLNTPSMKIGFQFKLSNKKKPNVILSDLGQTNKVGDDDEKVDVNENIDFITSIDNKIIKGTKSSLNSSDGKQIVIPLIKINKYIKKKENNDTQPLNSVNSIQENDSNNDIISKAKQELLNGLKNLEDESTLPAWKSLLINKVPNEYENDSKCDVSLRPEEPKLEDYEKIPVESFGAALLRGMGWSEGQAIGGINKAVTPIIEPKLRPKGLGLGADITLKKELEEKKSKNQVSDAILQKGCHVCVEFGPYKGFYGVVENIDDDLTYASVKLVKLNNISLPQDILRIVTKKEFDSESRVINKNKYDEYKNKELSWHRNEGKSKEDSKTNEKNYDKEKNDIWIVPKILVQIIDKKFECGKFYKDKIVILKTHGHKCVGQTRKSKRVVQNVSQSMLRTVIPSQSSSSLVMILRGEHKGKLARIEGVDWKKESAEIKLTGFIMQPFSISLNDISEFYES